LKDKSGQAREIGAVVGARAGLDGPGPRRLRRLIGAPAALERQRHQAPRLVDQALADRQSVSRVTNPLITRRPVILAEESNPLPVGSGCAASNAIHDRPRALDGIIMRVGGCHGGDRYVVIDGCRLIRVSAFTEDTEMGLVFPPNELRHFNHEAVIAVDFAVLLRGHRVTFDLGARRHQIDGPFRLYSI
jgi:hypothetical protein